MKKTLYIYEQTTEVANLLHFIAEDDNGKTYNVYFTIEDFEAYLGLEGLEPHAEGIDWLDHAQAILDAWQRGGTTYEVQVVKQKLKAYKFQCISGKTQTICATVVGNIDKFMKDNFNYTSSEPVFS